MTRQAERRDKPAPGRRESLAGIPVLDTGVRIAEGDASDDKALVLVSRRPRRPGLLSRFAPPILERRLELDELGAFVVRQFDGKRDVASIAGVFAERFRVCRREAELCTASFLKQLVKRRFAAIGMRT